MFFAYKAARKTNQLTDDGGSGIDVERAAPTLRATALRLVVMLRHAAFTSNLWLRALHHHA